MPNDKKSDPTGVARILYKQVVGGDLRKIQAQSNDTPSGGGARDFRFGDYKRLEGMVKKFFPNTKTGDRKRGDADVELEIFHGEFFHHDGDSNVVKQTVEFEPPTDARPTEGRIPRVHELPCFDLKRVPELKENEVVLLLLVQCNDSSVWPYFITESSLTNNQEWNRQVAEEILNCIRARRAAGRAVIGYKDYTTGESYCNGSQGIL